MESRARRETLTEQALAAYGLGGLGNSFSHQSIYLPPGFGGCWTVSPWGPEK